MIATQLNVMMLNFLIGSYELGWIKPFADPQIAKIAGGLFLALAACNFIFLLGSVLRKETRP